MMRWYALGIMEVAKIAVKETAEGHLCQKWKDAGHLLVLSQRVTRVLSEDNQVFTIGFHGPQIGFPIQSARDCCVHMETKHPFKINKNQSPPQVTLPSDL